MFKKTMTYTDFNGETRTEDFYFNLTKAEITKMEWTTPGGMASMLQSIIDARESQQIVDKFDMIVKASYGEKTPDGKHFIKSPELSEAFLQHAAYDDFFTELITNAEAATAFVNGIIPKVLEDHKKPDNLPGKTNL